MSYAIGAMFMAFMAGFCFCWSVMYFREMDKKVTALVPVVGMCVFIIMAVILCVVTVGHIGGEGIAEAGRAILRDGLGK